MSETSDGRRHAMLAALILAIGLTRLSTLLPEPLPDATLAALFLAGFYVRTLSSFVGLGCAVAAADWLALEGGVDGSCITPGYLLLFAGYFLIWRAGLWAGRLPNPALPRTVAQTLAALAVSVALAFVLSNLAFFAFSDAAQEMDPFAYLLAVSGYLPGYGGAALFYAVPVLAVGWLSQVGGVPRDAAPDTRV